jgi:sodium/potassium-transporting ATPase subunit alpha
MIPGVVDATSDNPLETRNLALTSTFVVQGTCTGITFAIGDKSVMGGIVAMSGTTKFKLTTVQKEVWFFTKIVSGLALSLFIISIIAWAAWLRTSFPGFETASGAIINSIGCLTAFVPQVSPYVVTGFIDVTIHHAGSSRLCCIVIDNHRQAHGKTPSSRQELGHH